MMRVLHLHSGNLFGGVEVVLRELAACSHLEPSLEHAFALCYEGKLRDVLVAEHASVHLLGPARLRRPASVLAARRALAQLIAERRPTACICHSTWGLNVLAPVVRSAGRMLVLWVHGPLSRRRWLDLLARRVTPDLLVCNSRYTAETASVLFPAVPLDVVYCPLRPRPVPGDRAEARRMVRTRLATPTDATVILQVGRVEPCKGQSVHLQALGHLRDVPGWVSWHVGRPQRPAEVRHFERLTGLARDLGIADRVRFVGDEIDPATLFAAADVYCQPNAGPEGFGITFIEALDAALPVVTTEIGGGREVVNGSCGMLVPPADVPALAVALRRLIADARLREQLGAAGPLRARALCDPSTQLARLSRVLTGAADARAGAPARGTVEAGQ